MVTGLPARLVRPRTRGDSQRGLVCSRTSQHVSLAVRRRPRRIRTIGLLIEGLVALSSCGAVEWHGNKAAGRDVPRAALHRERLGAVRVSQTRSKWVPGKGPTTLA